MLSVVCIEDAKRTKLMNSDITAARDGEQSEIKRSDDKAEGIKDQ